MSNAVKAAALGSLRHVGSREEIEQYLNIYSELPRNKFCVVKVGGSVLNDELDTLASSLALLSEVGLYPVVIHGAAPQIDEALQEAGIECERLDGLRVTSPEVLKIARKTLMSVNSTIVNAIEARGGTARPIQCGVFDVDFVDKNKYAYVGKIENVNLGPIEDGLRCGRIPVIACLGETDLGQILNISADAAGNSLATQMQPMKVIYLTAHGELPNMMTKDGRNISSVDMDTQYEEVLEKLSTRDQNRLREIKNLVDILPESSSVAFTSAIDLARELFTHRGSGTLMRKQEHVLVHKDLEDVDTKRVIEMMQDSFRKPVQPQYLENIKSKVLKVYRSENYRVVAVLSSNVDVPGVTYLDKFAMAPGSESTAHALWDKMIADYPKLCWRSRPSFEENKFFLSRASGSISQNGWTAFWAGFDDLEVVKECVGQAVKLASISVESRPVSYRSAAPAQSSRRYSTYIQRPCPVGVRRGAVTGRGESKYGATVSLGRSGLHWSRNAGVFSKADNTFNRCRDFSTRVGLIGARGHTGNELVNMIDRHSHMELVAASSRAWEGKTVSDVMDNLPSGSKTGAVVFENITPDAVSQRTNVDVWILAMPNGAAIPYVDELEKMSKPPHMIDLGADYRFDTTWSYGLPERKGARDIIKRSRRVANPGCYASAAQFSLLPLTEHLDANYAPTIFGVSGFSGAGTTPSRKNDLEALKDNIMPYSLSSHMHEKEVSFQFKSDIPDGVRFMPHVASWFRGISLTIAVQLDKKKHPLSTVDDVVKLFDEYYANEPLVHVTKEIPEVVSNANMHHACVGAFDYQPDTGRLVLVATIDNLLKGAATQCMQNMNLMLKYEEMEGISI